MSRLSLRGKTLAVAALLEIGTGCVLMFAPVLVV
jgi:hypothetical protein